MTSSEEWLRRYQYIAEVRDERRLAAPSGLDQDAESSFAGELQECWEHMSDEQRSIVDPSYAEEKAQLDPNAKPLSRSPVTVVVQSLEGRPVWDRTQQAIEASDIGKNYERMIHPPGMPLSDFFLSTLDRLTEADTDLVMRLEDDVVFMNEHIVHNASTWPAIYDARFGAGWLLAVGGCTATVVENHMYKQYGADTWLREFTPCCSAVLFWRKDLPEIIARCRQWFAEHPPQDARKQDVALAEAVFGMGREICVHAPSLVDHDEMTPSTLGHGPGSPVDVHTANGTFRKEWRR